MAHILIIEDERNLARLLRQHLEEDGYQVSLAFNGQTGLEEAKRNIPNLIILDLMLPVLDGLTVCRQLRHGSDLLARVPILMLTARAEEIDRVVGLEVGADDYVTKPFSIREVLARIHALLRRVEMDGLAHTQEKPKIQIAGLVLDKITYQASIEGEPLELSTKEFDLLYLLASHPARVFSRDYLLDLIWGYCSTGSDRTVDTHISRLRQKLSRSSIADRIIAIRGIGYKFDASK